MGGGDRWTQEHRGRRRTTDPGAPVRVLVVDDHNLFRTGLASVLAEHADIEVVAQASNGRLGVRLAHELRPGVVLMDLRLPDIDGVVATRTIVERDPAARVLVLTVATDEQDVVPAVLAGACGYLDRLHGGHRNALAGPDRLGNLDRRDPFTALDHQQPGT